MSPNNSSKGVIVKILIDFEDYLKLKEYQKQIEEIHSKKRETLRITPEEKPIDSDTNNTSQIGEGHQRETEGHLGSGNDNEGKVQVKKFCTEVNTNFIETIVAKVLVSLNQQQANKNLDEPKSQTGEGVDLLPPTANFIESNVIPPLASGSLKVKSTQHDKFDDKKLLDSIPTKFLKRATILLNKIKNIPLQIDFNSNGDLFIDGQNIPNANIYLIFPELFIRKKKRPIIGLSELATKISYLGCGFLIAKGITKGLKRPKNYKIHESTEHSLKEFKNWWYVSM